MSSTTTTTMRSANPFTLRLPQVFPTMTEPDTLTVLRWYAHEGEILQPPDPDHPTPLLEVTTNYGDIEITVPPFLRVPHRIVTILKPEKTTMHLGEQFITLQAVDSAE